VLKADMNNELVNRDEVCQMLSCSRMELHRIVQSGELKEVSIPLPDGTGQVTYLRYLDMCNYRMAHWKEVCQRRRAEETA